MDQFRDPFIKVWLKSRFDSTSPRKHFPQIYRAEDEERRLLPKRQAAGWGNERKVQKKTGYREARQYHTDFYFLQSVWLDEDKEQRLLPERQAVVWRNERKGQKEDRPQRSQTISHRLPSLSLPPQWFVDSVFGPTLETLGPDTTSTYRGLQLLSPALTLFYR